MNTPNKRRGVMEDNNKPKRVKTECSYGEKCYRQNPAHFREFSHSHLESILDNYSGSGSFPIPDKLHHQRHMITDQLQIILTKNIYEPAKTSQNSENSQPTEPQTAEQSSSTLPPRSSEATSSTNTDAGSKNSNKMSGNNGGSRSKDGNEMASRSIGGSKSKDSNEEVKSNEERKEQTVPSTQVREERKSKEQTQVREEKKTDSDYRPIVEPTRRPESFLKVVLPKGNMLAKHAASAPYHIFYTTISDARETHTQPYSITFLEILDRSLGELKCSLQINFMVEIGWLLAQYYFAGYSQKRLTVLYGEEMAELASISRSKPHVDAHHVRMPTPFGKHHTKMMILCYEDGSLRVVVSTANLYIDDWENRTQGLWFSPACPELPPDAMPFEGDSPTGFKKSLLRYLHHYHMTHLGFYVERVKRCDFSHINVFLIASAPGSHFDQDWGMRRVGSVLRQHCSIPPEESKLWPLVAQASSIGSYGKEPKLWLTGDFLFNFTKIKNQPQMLSTPPPLKLIYPSLENVRESHDGLLGGGCLPYAGSAHAKQTWLNVYLHQWKASITNRTRAMPHIKSYTRYSPDHTKAAYYLLTSGNVSKAAWGSINKGDSALRIASYEAGVLLLPSFVIQKDFFPLDLNSDNPLVIPYDIPPTKYTTEMSPWVSDYLRQ